MSEAARARIERAFEELARRPGYSHRADQRQVADLIGDCIESGSKGAFEAPTGLGKSLACLIPALAYALEGKRIVIATYTNVLAEQYFYKDLPLALSLFEAPWPEVELLMGKSRYACKIELEEAKPSPKAATALRTFSAEAKLGIERELRQVVGSRARGVHQLWSSISVPAVCAGRLCPLYEDCFYYSARRRAEKASLVITNHAVVLQDALMRSTTEGEKGLLGKVEMLLLDEAHDLLSAAASSFEFELSEAKVASVRGIAGRMSQAIDLLAVRTPDYPDWHREERRFQAEMEQVQSRIADLRRKRDQPGILSVSPADLQEAPAVRSYWGEELREDAFAVADQAADALQSLLKRSEDLLQSWAGQETLRPERLRETRELVRNYVPYLTEFVVQCRSMTAPQGVSVTSFRSFPEPTLRSEPIVYHELLRELVFDVVPAVALSATLAVDGQFDYFCRGAGFDPQFTEMLPTPFDFAHQAAVYLPPAGAIPDPTEARKQGTEDLYFSALAQQISSILTAAGGRSLVLFHSRREMNAVYERLQVPDDLPVLVQSGAAAGLGDRFREEIRSSLFAVRSFWTGFDAPGETLSVVVLVRVPFEVPVDPVQIARHAYFRSQGLDPFQESTLPAAKMMIRQGVGRLIRNTTDKGVVALLDSRLLTKRYGEEILDNLPPGMRTFRDVHDALGWVGLGSEPEDPSSESIMA